MLLFMAGWLNVGSGTLVISRWAAVRDCTDAVRAVSALFQSGTNIRRAGKFSEGGGENTDVQR
jgi:hypothetical protein